MGGHNIEKPISGLSVGGGVNLTNPPEFGRLPNGGYDVERKYTAESLEIG